MAIQVYSSQTEIVVSNQSDVTLKALFAECLAEMKLRGFASDVQRATSPIQLDDTEKTLARGGGMIAAIKALRGRLGANGGVSLKDAKDAVDAYIADHRSRGGIVAPAI